MTPVRSSSPSVPPGDARAAFARPAPLVGFLALLALLVLSQFYGALVLGPAAVAELDGGPGSAGLIRSVFGVSYAAGFLVWGPRVDRFGATRMLLLGLAVLAVTTGLVALAPGLPWLIAARIAQGAAAASFAPAAFAHVGAHLPPPARAAAITVFTSAFLAAAVLGQVAAQAVAEALSWRWFFGGSAILLAAALVVAVTRLRADGPLGSAPASPLRTLLRLLGSGAIPPLLLATLAILGPFTAVYAALGQAGPVAGGSMLALRLSALPALVWAGFAAPWLGRFRPEPRLLLGLLGSAAAAGAVTLFGSDPIGVGVGMFCFAAGVSLSAPAMIQTLTGLAPAQRGSVTALYTFALFLGASLAPVLVAALAANRPAVDPVATAALCAVPILLLAAALVALASRRRTTATLGAV